MHVNASLDGINMSQGMHISTRCTCNGEWGDCELDLEDNGTEWENLGDPDGTNDYTFRSKKYGCHVGAERIDGNRYAVNSFWS